MSRATADWLLTPDEFYRSDLRVRSVMIEVNRGLYMDVAEPQGQNLAPDVLDAGIRSKQTLDDVVASSSPISRRWGIVTTLKPEDFAEALRGARAALPRTGGPSRHRPAPTA
jgi:hypothetical protein